MTPPSTFNDLVWIILDIVNSLLVVLVGVALIVFFKGIISFIAKAGEVKSRGEGKSLMIWGIVALFVMVSVWGILRFFYSDFGFTRPFGLPLLPV